MVELGGGNGSALLWVRCGHGTVALVLTALQWADD